MPRIPRTRTERRDRIETAQVVLAVLDVQLAETILRIDQAMKRTALVVPVLAPALKTMKQIRKDLRLAQKALNDAWLIGQAGRWMEHDNDQQAD